MTEEIKCGIPIKFIAKVSRAKDDKRYLNKKGRSAVITELQTCDRGRVGTLRHKDMTDAQLCKLLIEVWATEMAEYELGTILREEPLKQLANMRGKY